MNRTNVEEKAENVMLFRALVAVVRAWGVNRKFVYDLP